MSKAMLSRREFLQFVTMTAAGAALAACAPAAPTPEPVVEPTPVPEAEATAVTVDPVDAKYSEAPMLAERVRAGTLPPVDERLPHNPKLINALPPEWLTPEIGKYGGTMRLAGPAVQYDNDGYMMHCTPLLNTPGILGDNITPNVLESFEANADQTEFTCKLRVGMRWSDGHPVTTEDVRFVWEDVYNNEELYAAGLPAWLREGSKADGGPATLEILDDFTFRVSFPGRYGGFPVALAIQSWRAYDVFLKPRHYLEQFHATYADPDKLDALVAEFGFDTWVQLFNHKDINSWAYMNERGLEMPKLSPWILTEATDQRCILERNPYYFKVDEAGQQLPYIDRIEYTTIRDLEVLALHQFAGGVDYGAETVTMPKLALYRENEEQGDYNLALGNIHRTSGVAFVNLTLEDEAWRKVVWDVRFRKALSIAIDRVELIDAVYYGLGEPSTLNPNVYDPAEAIRLLDEIGMDKRGPDGYRLDPDGNPFAIEFQVMDSFYDNVPATELYVDYWKAVGINSTMKVIDGSLWGQLVNANELKATTIFDVSTLWYYQAYGHGYWDQLWWRWWTTDGRDGEEPPEDVKELYRKREEIMFVPPEEGRAVAEECEKMIHDYVYYFIPTIFQKQPRIESKRLGNVTDNPDAFSIAQTLSMEQTFFKS